MSFVYQLGTSGQDGLVVDQDWLASQKKAGRICGRCAGVLRDRLSDMPPVRIVPAEPPPRIHYGMISGLYSGIFVSHTLAELLGRDELEKYNWLLSVSDTKRSEYPFTYVVEKEEIGCARGEPDSQSALCPDCGRLLYWADKWYILKRYWKKNSRAMVLNGAGFVDRATYERIVRPRKLSRLAGSKVEIADDPRDGLPADYVDMKSVIQKGSGCRPPFKVW